MKKLLTKWSWKRVVKTAAWMMIGVAGLQLNSEWGMVIFVACILMLFFVEE